MKKIIILVWFLILAATTACPADSLICVCDLVPEDSPVGLEIYQILTANGYDDISYANAVPDYIPYLLILLPGIREHGEGDYPSDEQLSALRNLLNQVPNVFVFGHKNLLFLPYTDYLGIDEMLWDPVVADSAWGRVGNFLTGLVFNYPETWPTYTIGDLTHDPEKSVLLVNNNPGYRGSRGVPYESQNYKALTYNINFSWILNSEGFNTKADLIVNTLKNYFGMHSTGVPGDNAPLPKELSLWNYPNPFNAQTIVNYFLPINGEVNLTIYNPLGQRVATLVDGRMKAGQHNVIWDAAENSSGIYFYKLTAGEKTITKRMTLVK